MIKRQLEAQLAKRINYKKAIILFGPRQVGKTTLVKTLAKSTKQEFIYFNGDDLITRQLWEAGNLALLKQSFGANKLIIIDEAQQIDHIGLTCKQLIDEENGLQLILTGSSTLDIANKTQEPLTGRKWEFFLYPISCQELMDTNGLLQLMQQLSQHLIYGMYPEVVTNLIDAQPLLINLSNSYLYKDILALTGIKKPGVLEKILQALAWQIGNEVSINELSRTVGVDVKTVDTYIDLLEQVFVVYRLGAFSRNLRNEINAKKKIYFYDSGIRNALIGNFSPPTARNDMGGLWENFLISERKKLLAYNGFYGRTWFWRNTQQAEIDYIEEIDGNLYAYEFKWNSKAKSKFPTAFVNAYQPAETRIIHPENCWEWLTNYPY